MQIETRDRDRPVISICPAANSTLSITNPIGAMASRKPLPCMAISYFGETRQYQCACTKSESEPFLHADLQHWLRRPGIRAKSLHRMLSEQGNPNMDNLAAIFGAVRKRLGVSFEADAVEAVLKWVSRPPDPRYRTNRIFASSIKSPYTGVRMADRAIMCGFRFRPSRRTYARSPYPPAQRRIRH